MFFGGRQNQTNVKWEWCPLWHHQQPVPQTVCFLQRVKTAGQRTEQTAGRARGGGVMTPMIPVVFWCSSWHHKGHISRTESDLVSMVWLQLTLDISGWCRPVVYSSITTHSVEKFKHSKSKATVRFSLEDDDDDDDYFCLHNYCVSSPC